MKLERFLKDINGDYVNKLTNAVLPKDILKSLQTSLKSDITTIRGRQFYHILNIVSEDFESDCDYAFEEYLKNKKRKTNLESNSERKTNKYRDFIKQFLVLQQDIADKANIENTRLSKVLNRTVKDFLAYEVYSIAKSQELDTKSAFEQLYKNGGDRTGNR